MNESDKVKLEQLRQDIATIGKMRPIDVLVIDDNDADRTLIKAELNRYEPLSINEAVDGQTAVKAIQKNNYDVVLLDMKMPGMDGLEVYKKIKTIKPDSRVFICTGYLNLPELNDALALGVLQVIGKDFLRPAFAEIFEPLCTKQIN